MSARDEIIWGYSRGLFQRMWLECTGWTWGCMGRAVGHFSHVELPSVGSFTPCLMVVTKQSRGTLLLPLGSLGVPVPRSVPCSQSEVLHVLEDGLGREKSISSALVCVAKSTWPTGTHLCCQPGLLYPCSTRPYLCPRDRRYSTARICASG